MEDVLVLYILNRTPLTLFIDKCTNLFSLNPSLYIFELNTPRVHELAALCQIGP
jgi:hypothetical protein